MASIRKRGENSYQITVSNGYDSNGKKLIKTKTVVREDGYTDKQWERELAKLATEFEREVERGTVLDGLKLTFAQFVDQWFEKYAERELEPKTVARYKELLELRILPAIGHIKLQKLQPTHLIDFYSNISEVGLRFDIKYIATPLFFELYENKKMTLRKMSALSKLSDKTITRALKGENITGRSAEKLSRALDSKLSSCFSPAGAPKPLSQNTILHHHRLISAILQDAVEWQLILSNPADRVKPPKVDKKPIQHYNEEETKALLAALDKEEIKYKAMVLLDIFSGLRLGELMGLNWSDIDFENSIIEITKASQYLTGKGTFEKKTKNETSIRKITIPTQVTAFLKEYRFWWLEQKLACGDLWQNSDRLFVTWDGKPLFTYTLTNWFPEFLQRHNLPKITPHGLRHTMASLLDSQGVEVSTISKRLGHARISTTLDIYTHVFNKADIRSSEVLEKTLLPKTVVK